MKACVLLVSLFSTPAMADWDRTDTAFQSAVTLSLAVDYIQTRRIIRDGKETNPVMGDRGERLSPEIYFGGLAVLHAGTMYVLPRNWRRLAQSITMCVEFRSIGINAHVGYGLSF